MIAHSQSATLVIFLVLTACYQDETAEESKDIYVPFSSESVEAVSPKGSKILENNKLFVRIKPGKFLMGSPQSEIGRSEDENQHSVRITKSFWMSRFEVTNEVWNKHMPFSLRRGSPIYLLSAKQFKNFCNSENYVDGHYTISEYEKTYFFEEVVANYEVAGNWELRLENRKSYKINADTFPNINAIRNNLTKLGLKPIGLLGQKNPVTYVSYSQATSFCWRQTDHAHQNNLLSRDLIFRLPTEAEWEYACRAGNTGVCGLGEGSLLSGMNACLNGSRPEYVLGGGPKPMLFNRKKISPINKRAHKYKPNKWGLFDMHGNVMEWCHDFYAPYSVGPISNDPLGPFNGSRRVVRGGSFFRIAHDCRSASRSSYEPSYRGSEIGFRLVIGHRLI